MHTLWFVRIKNGYILQQKTSKEISGGVLAPGPAGFPSRQGPNLLQADRAQECSTPATETLGIYWGSS